MSEMVEKVARAICIAESDERGPAAYAPGSDPWNVLQRSSKRPYYAMARAAIEAMMEPTPEMCAAPGDGPNTSKRVYQTMLRASLTEGE